MSYLSFLLAAILYALNLGFKYVYFRQEQLRLPSYAEVRRYTIENNTERRNARAFKVLAIFFVMFGLLCIPFDQSLSELLESKDFASRAVGLLLLLVFGINFFARFAIFKEHHLEEQKYAVPIIEISDVFRKTGWSVKGSDFLSVVVNATTAIGVLLIATLIFFVLN